MVGSEKVPRPEVRSEYRNNDLAAEILTWWYGTPGDLYVLIRDDNDKRWVHIWAVACGYWRLIRKEDYDTFYK